MQKPIFRLLIVLLLCLAVSPAVFPSVPHIGQQEIDFGKEAAQEAEKDNRILDDEKLLARVQTIGTPIAVAANNTEVPADYGSARIVDFPYTFKIIDSDEVNAFSIPGGHIYIFKGLIKACESDHELAGVIAHEIAHCAHHHMIRLLREQARLEGSTALLLVAGLASNVNARDMSNIMLGAQCYKVGKVNGYGQMAEEDADKTALTYMRAAGYNPVGMLTFLERLAERPEVVDWGIMQTHPRASDRVRAVKDQLAEMGVEINRRAVTTSTAARVETSGTGGCTVMIGTRCVCRLAGENQAKSFSGCINSLLDSGLQIHEIRVEGRSVRARGEPIVTISDADAAMSGKTADDVAQQAADALRSVLFRNIVNDTW